MCGIAGIVRWDGQPPSGGDVQAMCDVMVHRGPDDHGLYVDEAAALGMRRLSIIDLATGHQPVSNEDGTIWTVFNGEIYNYRELRRDLESRGHRFRTATDTETIVHLYEEYGRRAVERMRGMFTFAVWDAPRRQLLLARDRLGIKPLYYTCLPGGLAFASELKAIVQLGEVERRLNWRALRHFVTFLATPPDQSILDGVRKLEPAHTATFSGDGHLRLERYWRVEFNPDPQATEERMTERLRELLEEAVQLHLESDVPVGAFLSGGLDSSAVVAMMTRLQPGRIKTFSIGFADAAFDESPYAARVAAELGTEHHALVVEPQPADVIESLVWYLDEPFGDCSAIPTMLVSKLAAEHVKVVLSGDGGDELFAGYDKYVVEGRERGYDRMPTAVRRLLGAVGHALPHGATGRNFLCHAALRGAERYLDACALFRPSDQASLFSRDAFDRLRQTDPFAPAIDRLSAPDGAWLSALQQFDLEHYLPLDILTKADRMSMAQSIELRPALLDHRLVEFAATIPPEMQMRGGTTKHVLKRAMRGVLPEAIIDRPKHGFAVPVGRWFRREWADYVRDLLLSDRSRQRGVLDQGHVERLLQLHDRGRDLDLQVWTLVSFELWCRAFLDTTRTFQRTRATRRAPVAAVPAFSGA